MHHSYMIVISVVFVLVFAIMIHSMIRHRKACGHSPAKFSGSTGTGQWFWALVPLAILAYIDFSLFGVAHDRTSVAAKKIELAAAQNLPATLPAPADITPMSAERGADKSSATPQQQALQ